MADSEDELAGREPTPPITYEFQSELSDDASPPPMMIVSDLVGEEPALQPPAPPEPTVNESIDLQPEVNADDRGSDEDFVADSDDDMDLDDPELEDDDSGFDKDRIVKIDVAIPQMSADERAEYQYVEVSDEEPPSWFGANGLLRYDDDDEFAFRELKRSSSEMSGKRKPRGAHASRKRARFADSSSDEDQGSYKQPGMRASRSRGTSAEDGVLYETSTRRLRDRATSGIPNVKSYSIIKDDDMDELQQDPEDDQEDNDFLPIITSDVQPQRGRPRKGTKSRAQPTRGKSNAKYATNDDSEVEFETRRSGRANRVTKSMRDPVGDDDDDIFYEGEEVTQPAAPRILNIKEVFQPCESEDFKKFHRPVCNTCGHTESKGTLIYCQGCSNSFHKVCLGPRTGRPQRVTKIGEDNFVLQCQYCVGKTQQGRESRGPRRPHQDACQSCREKGKACAAFTPKRNPKAEERLREENGGVDPITKISPKLLNNADNLLFRCSRCRRGWHYDHLPHPTKLPDPAIKDPENRAKHRLQEYSIYWLCTDCYDVQEDLLDKVVAWRPRDKKKRVSRDLKLESFNEDDLEYLVKWKDKSYAYCTWKPGAWLYEYAASSMRISFYRRVFESEDLDSDEDQRSTLMKFNKKEAIPDAFLTPEVILDVRWAPRSKEQEAQYKKLSPAGRKEADMARIYHVLEIFVKYEGLSYHDVVWDTPHSPDSPFYAAFEAAYEDFLLGKHFKQENPKEMRERLETFRTLNFEKEIMYDEDEGPKGFKNGKLMKYQIEGLNWILLNYRNEQSVILADEMGLGKTVQVVAFLRGLVLDKPMVWPFLVVVPNATCQNWRREIKKWAPELRVVLYYGGAKPQELSYKYELFPDGSKYLHAHIVVMSYQSASDPSTKSRFSSVKWSGLVVDEAHSLKNDQNNLPKALKALRIPFSLLLTGTPLQNNKRELFTLISFVNPKIDVAALDEKYNDDNLTEDTVEELHELIRPYFLRRTKAGVLKFLPPMSQIIVPLSMTVLQEKLCKSILEKNPELIRAIFAKTKLKAGDKTGMNNILLQLRKCLCHPFIYSRQIEDRNVSAEVGFRTLIEASSKLLLLEVMLPKLKERGHRVLIFSQFLGQLDILEDFMIGIGLKYQRIDGEIGGLEKQKRIDQFNAPDSTLFAMLLSTRAGGVGINLATADTVIILDPDWNPHQDIQALSRAHRIGQTKKVLCFQLVTQASAEEKIMQIGRKKMALDHVLIETMDREKGGEGAADIESALRYGAAALFGEDQKKETIKYDAAAVDKLLGRADEEDTVDDSKPAESLFANAKVWANDANNLKEADEGEEKTVSVSVWDDIIKQREEEARLERVRNQQILGRGGRRRLAANYTMDDGEDNENGDGADEDFVGAASDPESSDPENGDEYAEINGLKKGKGSQDVPGTQTPIPPPPIPKHIPKTLPAAVPRPSPQHVEVRLPSGPPTPGSTGEPIKRKRGRPTNASRAAARAAHPSSVPGAGQNPNFRPGGGAPSIQNGSHAGLPTHSPFPGTASGIPARIPPGITPSQFAHMVQNGAFGNGAGGSNAGLSAETIALLGKQMPGLKAQDLQAALGAPSRLGVPSRPATQQMPAAATPKAQPRPQQAPPPAQRPQPVSKAVFTRQGLCFVCNFAHPPHWECPEMQDKVKLRLALDSIRTASDMTLEQRQHSKGVLMAKLGKLQSGG